MVIACCTAVPQMAMADPAPDPAKLSNLVRQDCGSCHGLTLKGGLGKPLTAQHLRQWDRDQLVHIILNGVPGTPMPGWRPLLTETEAGWIADFLQKETHP
jgi:cytochrome c55X